MNNNPLEKNEIMYDQDISLVDILVRLVRIWKKTVLAAVIGAVLLVTYYLYKSSNSEPVLVMTAEQITEADAKIIEMETLISTNLGVQSTTEASVASLESSIDVNVNAIEKKESEIIIAEDNIEELKSLEEIYKTTVDAILEANNVDEDFASDVMNLTVKMADTRYAIYENESRIITLKKEIRDLKKENEVIIPKEIEKYEEQIAKINDDIELTYMEINSLKAEMAATTIQEFSAIKLVVYAALGMVLGLMAICGYVTAVMVFDGKIHNAKVLEENFHLHMLGTIFENRNKEKRTFLDKWISKLTGPKQKFSSTEEKRIVATKLKTLSKMHKVMAIGTINAENIRSVVSELKNTLNGSEFELVAAGNPMYSPETMNLLKNYELVLVEKVDETNIKELAKLIRFLQYSEISILGVILE